MRSRLFAARLLLNRKLAAIFQKVLDKWVPLVKNTDAGVLHILNNPFLAVIIYCNYLKSIGRSRDRTRRLYLAA